MTAAEMGSCEDEGAARRVPLGSEMDMILCVVERVVRPRGGL